MIDTIASIASSLSSAATLTKTILGMKVDQEVIAKVSELQSAIMAAQNAALASQSQQTALMADVRDLKEKLRDKEAWDAVERNYVLKEFPTGAQLYEIREEYRGDGPIHRICTNCYSQKKRSIIQTIARHSGGEIVQCPACQMKITLSNFRESVSFARPRDDFWA